MRIDVEHSEPAVHSSTESLRKRNRDGVIATQKYRQGVIQNLPCSLLDRSEISLPVEIYEYIPVITYPKAGEADPLLGRGDNMRCQFANLTWCERCAFAEARGSIEWNAKYANL